jgi:hypothetical protein
MPNEAWAGFPPGPPKPGHFFARQWDQTIRHDVETATPSMRDFSDERRPTTTNHPQAIRKPTECPSRLGRSLPPGSVRAGHFFSSLSLQAAATSKQSLPVPAEPEGRSNGLGGVSAYSAQAGASQNRCQVSEGKSSGIGLLSLVTYNAVSEPSAHGRAKKV